MPQFRFQDVLVVGLAVVSLAGFWLFSPRSSRPMPSDESIYFTKPPQSKAAVVPISDTLVLGLQ